MPSHATTADARAIAVARAIHRMADPTQTILFGSRARGDHRPDSDIDVLIIKDPAPPEDWLENLRDQARTLQKAELPEASGIDVICMTANEFGRRRQLRNNLANSIARQGALVLSQEHAELPEETIDWDDIAGKLKDAAGAANGLAAIAGAGILGDADDKQIGRMAQNALENAYKSVLGAYGFEYPAGGRDGHNLRILIDRVRENVMPSPNAAVPGEEYRYLTEFGGAALYSREHLPLDKTGIARGVPEAVARLQDLAETAKGGQSNPSLNGCDT